MKLWRRRTFTVYFFSVFPPFKNLILIILIETPTSTSRVNLKHHHWSQTITIHLIDIIYSSCCFFLLRVCRSNLRHIFWLLCEIGQDRWEFITFHFVCSYMILYRYRFNYLQIVIHFRYYSKSAFFLPFLSNVLYFIYLNWTLVCWKIVSWFFRFQSNHFLIESNFSIDPDIRLEYTICYLLMSVIEWVLGCPQSTPTSRRGSFTFDNPAQMGTADLAGIQQKLSSASRNHRDHSKIRHRDLSPGQAHDRIHRSSYELGAGQVLPPGYTDRNGQIRSAGQIKLGLIISKGQLEVEVIAARNLPVDENNMPPDTFAKVIIIYSNKENLICCGSTLKNHQLQSWSISMEVLKKQRLWN